jgi:hypothetical protein
MAAVTAQTNTSPGAESIPSRPPDARDLDSLAASSSVRAFARIALYALPALLFIRRFGIVDLDIWWHLATGRWILQHHAIPRTDPFSVFGMGQPWCAYSWLFDLVVQGLFAKFGFVGIVLFEIAARVIIAVALFHLIHSLLPRFWPAVALNAVSLGILSHVIGPRPAVLTIIFTIVELNILLSARRTGNTKKLWILPLLLLIWANWHIQFVYGLLVLGVFAAEALWNSLWNKRAEATALHVRQLWIALVACAFATLLNPFGPRVYETVFQYMHQPKVFSLVVELRAMDFRHFPHFFALFLALSAAMAVGWRRDLRPLWPLLLFLAAFLAFRSVKELWFLTVISACALADGWAFSTATEAASHNLRERAFVVLSVLALLAVGFRYYDVDNTWLEMQVAGNFPESAAIYIERHHLAGPLYNDFNDGGYLIWRLPWLPVAIDGRTNVHGDERVAHSSAVWSGKPGWDSDPELLRANIIVASKNSTFASLLRLDNRFKVVFEDVQTVVFQPH